MPRGEAFYNILRDNAFNIGKNPNMTGINIDLLQWFKFDKRSIGWWGIFGKSSSGGEVKSENMLH